MRAELFDSRVDWSKAEARFNALSEQERRILGILAINVAPLSQTALVEVLRRLRIRDSNGILYLGKTLKPVLQGLTRKRILSLEDSPLWSPVPEMRVLGLLHTLDREMFGEIFLAIQELPTSRYTYTYMAENYYQCCRKIQKTLFYQESQEALDELLEQGSRAAYQNFMEAPPLEAIWFSPWHPRLLDHLPVEKFPELTVYLLEQTVYHLLPVNNLDHLLDRLTPLWCQEIQESGEPPFDLPELFLLIDRAERTEDLLAGQPMSELLQLYLQGWLAMLKGQTEHCLQHFDAYMQRYKKATRKRTVILPDFGGFLYLLALLRSGDIRRLEQGQDYIELLLRRFRKTRPLEIQLCIDLQPCFLEQLGGQPATIRRPTYLTPQFEQIMLLMILTWVERKQARRYTRVLEIARDRAIDIQNLWLAAEAAETLVLLESDVSMNRAIADEIWKNIDLSTLTNSFKSVPPWQKTVRALVSLADQLQPAGDAANTESRLVWFFHYDEVTGSVDLTARIQKRLANGRWSKGRPVSCRNLVEKNLNMVFLSEQDRRIIKTITRFRNHPSPGGKIEYSFNMSQSLPALCGHPFVFLEDSPTSQVELIRAEPELQIKKTGKKFQFQMEPALQDPDSRIVLVRESPTRFLVYVYNKRQRQLAQILLEQSTLPEEAITQLRSSLPTLASLLPIQSDLDIGLETAVQVQADSRLHAHLLPVEEGLQLEFLVRPLPDGGSWYRPGHGRQVVLAGIKGKQVLAHRDLDQERKQLASLLRRLPILEHYEPVGNRYRIDSPEDCLELLLQLKMCAEEVVLHWPKGKRYSIRAESSFSQLSLQIRKDRDWFLTQGALEVDSDLCLQLKDLLDRLDAATGRFIPLDDGSFLALTHTFKKRIEELRQYGKNHGQGVRIPPLASLALDELTTRAGKLTSDRTWKRHIARLEETISPELPSTLKAELRPYQIDGFRWLAQLAHWQVGGCLADDMGLGKTLQALAVLLRLADQGPSLVVAPVSVLANWEDEAARFAPTLRMRIYGQGDRQKLLDMLQPFDVVVCSYGLLPLEIERLEKVRWQAVVLDEAQAIKNAATKRSRAAMRLKAGFRLITTGTPVENNLTELWSLFRFLNPGLLGSQKQFRERFALPIERDQDQEARQRLRKLIQPFLLRRLKSDVLSQLPPRTDITLKVTMGQEEMALYEAHRQTSLERLAGTADQDGEVSPLQILAEITKLRRLCCNPRLVLGNGSIASSKLQLFGEIMDELLANRHKVLVFSQFVDHLQIIREYLDQKKIHYQYLDGSIAAGERKQRVARFQAGEGDVFLISLRAGGTGLNLTAADYVIHMDPWWNPAVEDQASDRAHRIGQERPVTVYRLVMEGTIEEQIVDLHQQKRRLADSLLAGSEKISKISAAELLQLLKESGKGEEQ